MSPEKPDTRKEDIENHIFNAVSSSDINKNNRLYAVSLFHVINEVYIYIAFIRNFVRRSVIRDIAPCLASALLIYLKPRPREYSAYAYRKLCVYRQYENKRFKSNLARGQFI